MRSSLSLSVGHWGRSAPVHHDLHEENDGQGKHHGRGGSQGSGAARQRRAGGGRRRHSGSSLHGAGGGWRPGRRLQRGCIAACSIGAGSAAAVLQQGGGLARATQPAGRAGKRGRLGWSSARVSTCAFKCGAGGSHTRSPAGCCGTHQPCSLALRPTVMTHATKGQMVAGAAEQVDRVVHALGPTTRGASVNRLRSHTNDWSCSSTGGGSGG